MPVMTIGSGVDGGFLGVDEYINFDLSGFDPVLDEIDRRNLVFSDGTTTISIQGVGFSVDFVGGVPTAAGGKIARFVVSEGTDTILTLKGLGMSLENLLTAAAQELSGSNPLALEQLFLKDTYNWVYNGNALSDQLLPESISADGAALDLNGNDRIRLAGGDDAFAAAGGNDLLKGGSGDDSLWGEAGRDKVNGQAGDDDLYGGADNDVVKGGAGADTASGGDGNDTVIGGGGDDIVMGDAGDDHVIGNGGADILMGGDGNDSIVGGGGDDMIYGGLGDDILTGRGGADVFDFSVPSGENPATYDTGMDRIEGYRLNVDSVVVSNVADWSITSPSGADVVVTNGVTGAQIHFLDVENESLTVLDLF